MVAATQFFPDFPWINNLFSSLPDKNEPNGMPGFVQLRLKEREKEIADIAKTMGYFYHDKIVVSMAQSDPLKINAVSKLKITEDPNTLLFKSDEPGSIVLEPFFLLDAEDFPKELRLSGLNDPKLKSEMFLNQVIDWSYRFLELDKTTLTHQNRKFLHNKVQHCLKFFLDPDLAKRARHFVFAHEVAHLYNRDGVRSQNFLEEIKKDPLTQCGGIPAVGAFIVFVIIGLATSFSLVGLLLAGGIGVLTFVVAFKVNRNYLISANRRMHETQADLLAVKTLKDAEGAYHFLKNEKDFHGDFPSLFESHPNFSERIAAIQKSFKQFPHLAEQSA